MARRWTSDEEQIRRGELVLLYTKQNKTIREIAQILGIGESSVYDRMIRLEVPSTPERKLNYRNIRKDVVVPCAFSTELAEFVGIMLGDGHLSPTQITVAFSGKELTYVLYVKKLAQKLFGVEGRYYKDKNNDAYYFYIGSTALVRFFKQMGLVSNKVQEQVDVPRWIHQDVNYQRAILRGLFDTDGSVYRLRFGFQINLCNKSRPLLASAQSILSTLGYHPSRISADKIYLTRIPDLQRYVTEIGFGNTKHLEKIVRFGILARNGRFV